MEIDNIRHYISSRSFKITDHAFEEMWTDDLTFEDVIAGVMSGDIIESYPESYPLPACLINGKTVGDEPVHVCVSLPPLVKVITVYRPDPMKWTDNFQKRRLE